MNYSKLFEEHAGKTVKVVMTDGEVFEGDLFAYISPKDNEPDPESIVVGQTELFTNEIQSVEVK